MTAPTTGLELLRLALTEQEAADPRALQVETGASQAMSCRAESLFRLLQVPESDSRLRLDATIGKAAHAYVEAALRRVADRFELLVEHRATYQDVPCTIDLGWVGAQTLIDWKFPKKSKIARLKKDGIGQGYRAQIHLGGAALRAEGHDIHTVGLALLPRDGEFEEGWEWSEPLDLAVADAAAEQVASESARAAELCRKIDGQHDPDEVIAAIHREINQQRLRDEHIHFCRDFCPWITTCRGPEREAVDPADPITLEAAQQYAAAYLQKQEAELLMEEWGPYLAGQPPLKVEGAKIRWVGGNPKTSEVTDTATALEAYELLVGPLPTKTVESTTPRYLRVFLDKIRGGAA